VGVVAVVLMVRAVTTGRTPLTCAETAAQVGPLVEPGGLVTEHVSATAPVKPSLGATVTADEPLMPGDVSETGVALRAKLCTPGPMPLVTESVVEDG